MTSVMTDTKATTTSRAAPLRTLTWLEVKRYARHPVFIFGVLVTLWSLWAYSDDPQVINDPAEVTFFPVITIGLLGVIVGYRLDRNADMAAATTDAAPVSRTTRTAALCLATLFPAAVGAGLTAMTIAVGAMSYDLGSWTSGAGLDVWIPGVLAGVVACGGGPLFGIVTARWCRFLGAGLLAMVVLAAWTLIATYGLTFTEPTRLTALVHGVAPFTVWTSASEADTPLWQVEGSPLAHLAFVVTLCFLGAVFAMIRDAHGEQRRSLWRWFAALGVTALVMLALVALPEPMRVPL